jgi:dethiobiotin synthetase
MPPTLTLLTGTDTGVGKTVLTGLLLAHLRQAGTRALALKPFCSGSRSDPSLLAALQDFELDLDIVNPFFFKPPLAPLVAARQARRRIPLSAVLAHIRHIARACDHLLIEGAGGLMVPLGEGYTTLDLIKSLRCRVIVVARNRLGTINHTLLTANALCRNDIKPTVVLFDPRRPDASSLSNPLILRELLAPVPILTLPWLDSGCRRPSALKTHAQKLKSTLAQILSP